MNLPAAFYFTDETRTHSVIETITQLPANTGVIFRHYTTPNRRKLGQEIADICKKQGLFLAVAGDPRLAVQLEADALHLPERLISRVPRIRAQYSHLAISCACHTQISLKAAENLGADLAFLSPIYKTVSHIGTQPLGIHNAARWIKDMSIPVYALGGINSSRFNQLTNAGFSGFGAISLFKANKS